MNNRKRFLSTLALTALISPAANGATLFISQQFSSATSVASSSGVAVGGASPRDFAKPKFSPTPAPLPTYQPDPQIAPAIQAAAPEPQRVLSARIFEAPSASDHPESKPKTTTSAPVASAGSTSASTAPVAYDKGIVKHLGH